MRHGFIDEKALTTTTLISSCHWKTLAPFSLWKKRPENAFLTLIVNYPKIACPPKQRQTDYLMINDVIYSLLVFIKKLSFFN